MKKLCIYVMTCFLLTSGYAQKESVFVQDTLNHWLTYNIPGQTVIDSLGIPDLEGEIEYWESDEPLITSTFVTTKGIRIGTPKKQVLDIYDVHIDKTYDVPHKVQNQLLIGNLYEGTIFNFHEDKVFTIEMGYFSE